MPRSETGAAERRWPLAAATVRLRAPDARLFSQIEPWLRFFLPAGSDETPAVALTIEFLSTGLPASPPADPHPIVEYYYVAGYRGGAGVLYRTRAGSWLELDAAARAARGAACEEDLAGPPWALRDLFNATLTACLRARGRFALHAAALDHDGEGVLVIGSAMAGKTTLGLNLARHGWTWLADDKVLLHEPGDGVPVVSGLLRHANLDPGLARWFPELDALTARPPVFAHTNKRAVELGEISRQASPRRLIPRRLLFPEVLDLGPTRVEPLDPEGAFVRLLQQAPLVRDGAEARRHVGLLRRLALGAPAFRVIAGRDILAEPSRFAEVAAELGLPVDPPLPFPLTVTAPALQG